MSSRWLRLPALLAPLLLVGCGLFASRPAPEEAAPEDNETRLPQASPQAQAWLALPRAELARLCAEKEKEIAERLEAIRRYPASASLLPSLRVPAQGPVFGRAAFRQAIGLTLPDYSRDGKPDPAVALHLARHGDREAASRLGGASLPALERNYPVEWTRLVGLSMTLAQLKLAGGDREAAALLVKTHEQLVGLLGPRARASALATVLLSAGRRTLQMAARAWRDPSRNMAGLAEDIEKALMSWGELPPQRLPDLDAAQLAAVRRGAGLDRLLDLLAVPLPAEGVLAVASFADHEGKLVGVQVAYRSGIDKLYPAPAHLAHWLEERNWLAGAEHKDSRLQRQQFHTPLATADIVRTNRSPLVGAIVTIGPAKSARQAARPRSLRVFGLVDLDRPFSASRFALSPLLAENSVLVSDKQSLARMTTGLGVPAPAGAALERDTTNDLTSTVRLLWGGDLTSDQAGQLLEGLGEAYGVAKVVALDAKGGGGLALEWKDEKTRAELRLPFDDKGPVLSAFDTQKDAAPRLARAKEIMAQERKARLDAGKPQLRITPGPETINGIETPGLRVGKTKAEAEESLARLAGSETRRGDLPDGASLTLLTSPSASAHAWARQVLVRFVEGKVAEVRVRYQEAAGKQPRGADLGEQLASDPRLGPGETVTASWDGLWRGLSAQKATARRWRDDAITRTFQRDVGGCEVSWRERPIDDAPARPWRFVSRGVPGAELGDSLDQIERALGRSAAKSGEADVFRLPDGSPYEMVLVWFKKGVAVRVLAVHRARPGKKPAEVLLAMQQAWGREVATLGFIRRQEPADGPLLGAMGWHDDTTQVRMTVHRDRLTTEWRGY